jgi:YVTN family beta-propeller protein
MRHAAALVAPGLLALTLSGQAMAQENPTYTVGTQPNGSIVTAFDQVLTPAGKQVGFGAPARVTSVAVQPAGQTGAVLVMGASAPVHVFNLKTGEIVQTYVPFQDQHGSPAGLTYSADGQYLFMSQDDGYVSIAKVAANGFLTDFAQVTLPQPSFVYGGAYPNGLAVSANGTRLYAVENQSNALAVIDLTQSPPAVVTQIPVGNVPVGVVISGQYAYVSNEGGRVATAADFTVGSDGVNIVADKRSGASITGTVSVIDLTTNTVIKTIPVGLHPTGMTLSGPLLFVANANSDSVTEIDTTNNHVIRTISLKPFAGANLGSTPSALTVVGAYLFVTLATNNAVAVVDLNADQAAQPLVGFIPTAAYPVDIAYDPARNQLVVANSKGTGTQGALGTASPCCDVGYNSLQDTGTVSIIPVPNTAELAKQTTQVFRNNRWDLSQNINVGPQYVNPNAKPVAIPAHIGEPSLIKHVFLVVKENRTYDQVLGDVTTGNGDPSLAIFGQVVTPNFHALVQRFPLMDNFYDSGRMSGDGHNWIVSSIVDYNTEMQVPDWVRSYPYNGGDAMAYTASGFLWQAARQHGIGVRIYGEYANTEDVIYHRPVYPDWSAFYQASQILEGAAPGPTDLGVGTVQMHSDVPSADTLLDRNFPGFDTEIPDQYRLDMFKIEFDRYVKNGNLPGLIIMTFSSDHNSGISTGYPVPASQEADNDLAVGRLIDMISHSPYWQDSAIFIEEDDAQNGVDHVDGHRTEGHVISPYTRQNGYVDHTYYTQVNMNRTIEQILGFAPLTQFDLAASPMRTLFTNTPNTAPYSFIPATTSLTNITGSNDSTNQLHQAWRRASDDMFRNSKGKPDMQDANMLNHVDWYSATGFKRPYPGETRVLAPAEVTKTTGSDD